MQNIIDLILVNTIFSDVMTKKTIKIEEMTIKFDMMFQEVEKIKQLIMAIKPKNKAYKFYKIKKKNFHLISRE